MITSSFLLWGSLIWSSTVTSFSHSLAKRQNSSEPAGGVCRLWDHRSAMIDGWIFIDNGIATWRDSRPGYYAPFTTRSFGINLKEPFGLTNVGPEGPPYIGIPPNRDVPPTMKGAIWADKDNNIYKYGGYYLNNFLWGDNTTIEYYNPKPSELYKLDTTSLNWTRLPQPGGDTVAGARNGGTAFVPEIGKGYFVGGIAGNTTDAVFTNWTHGETLILDTLLTYDMQNNTWKNTTTPFDPFYSSSLIHIPVGEKGILVSLGGTEIPKNTFNYTGDQMTDRDMDSIDIYDIEGETWYTQRASGFIPPDRQQFCAVAAIASDNSSYNIIIHGGVSGAGDKAYSDIYVLSMPSFKFIKIDEGTKAHRRYDHTCHLVGGKMVVIGGRDADQINLLISNIDTWKKGGCDSNGIINVLDINTFQWEDSYDPSASRSYLVHETIYEDIGGNENGCATVLEPDGGWSAARIHQLFGDVSISSSCPTTTTTIRTTATSTVPSTTSSTSAAMPRTISILYFGLVSLAALANVV